MAERKRGTLIYSNSDIYKWLAGQKESTQLLDKFGLEFERRVLTDARTTARMSISYVSPHTEGKWAGKERRYSCGMFPTDSIEARISRSKRWTRYLRRASTRTMNGMEAVREWAMEWVRKGRTADALVSDIVQDRTTACCCRAVI
jgi:hypothetical protein